MTVTVKADWYEVGRKGRLSFYRDYSDDVNIATFNTWDYVQEVQTTTD
jgi:hypothetical protein